MGNTFLTKKLTCYLLIWSNAPCGLKFRPLDTVDKRFAFRCAQAQPAHSPPLDHGAVTSGYFYLKRRKKKTRGL